MTIHTVAPTLITERLILDAHRLEDFDDLAAMWADPAVVRYIGSTPRDKEDSWGRLLRYIGHWKLLGYGYWAVREKNSGRYIGGIGFADFHRDIHPALDVPEMGWTLITAAHGKGYATEALNAALVWAKENFSQDKVVCIISPDNRPSLGLAKKSALWQATAANTTNCQRWCYTDRSESKISWIKLSRSASGRCGFHASPTCHCVCSPLNGRMSTPAGAINAMLCGNSATPIPAATSASKVWMSSACCTTFARSP